MGHGGMRRERRTASTAGGGRLGRAPDRMMAYRIAHLMVFLISLELVRAGLMGMLGW